MVKNRIVLRAYFDKHIRNPYKTTYFLLPTRYEFFNVIFHYGIAKKL